MTRSFEENRSDTLACALTRSSEEDSIDSLAPTRSSEEDGGGTPALTRSSDQKKRIAILWH